MNTNVVNLQNSNTSSGKAAPTSGQNLGKDDFMKLLLTQLSQQDPLNPQDSTAFVQQLSQFASLENLQNLGTKMDKLVTGSSVSLMGKDVRIAGNQFKGSGTVYYELQGPSKGTRLNVYDANRKIVKSIGDLPTTTGLHGVKITDLPSGSYTFGVDASDAAGNSIDSQLSVGDTVKGVNFGTSGSPILLMDSGNQMNASDVLEIHEGSSVPSTASVQP